MFRSITLPHIDASVVSDAGLRQPLPPRFQRPAIRLAATQTAGVSREGADTGRASASGAVAVELPARSPAHPLRCPPRTETPLASRGSAGVGGAAEDTSCNPASAASAPGPTPAASPAAALPQEFPVRRAPPPSAPACPPAALLLPPTAGGSCPSFQRQTNGRGGISLGGHRREPLPAGAKIAKINIFNNGLLGFTSDDGKRVRKYVAFAMNSILCSTAPFCP